MSAPDVPTTEDGENTAKTTVTSFRVVEALKGRDTAGVSELADELDLAKGTVHKHLNTLRQLDYVVKEGHSYRLSLSFLGLGTSVRTRLPIYEAAQLPLKKLATATGEVASVMIPEHSHGVYVLRVSDEEQPGLAVQEGERVPMHATAGGKAILAYTSPEKRDRILDRRGVPELTENTITDRDSLADELQLIHDRRTAYDRSEFQSHLHCVASPITNQDGQAVAAVSVSGPDDRMDEEDATTDFASIVGSTASSIQNRLLSEY